MFCENPRMIFVLFYDVHKENMFTINLEDGREAPSKASNDKNEKFPKLGFSRNTKLIDVTFYQFIFIKSKINTICLYDIYRNKKDCTIDWAQSFQRSQKNSLMLLS